MFSFLIPPPNNAIPNLPSLSIFPYLENSRTFVQNSTRLYGWCEIELEGGVNRRVWQALWRRWIIGIDAKLQPLCWLVPSASPSLPPNSESFHVYSTSKLQIEIVAVHVFQHSRRLIRSIAGVQVLCIYPGATCKMNPTNVSSRTCSALLPFFKKKKKERRKKNLLCFMKFWPYAQHFNISTHFGLPLLCLHGTWLPWLVHSGDRIYIEALGQLIID